VNRSANDSYSFFFCNEEEEEEEEEEEKGSKGISHFPHKITKHTNAIDNVRLSRPERTNERTVEKFRERIQTSVA